ncbi:MAG: response regulator [Deltaproteobacteria bacterium]|nr:response regulator [Deltaproteobacteria bacterium]
MPHLRTVLFLEDDLGSAELAREVLSQDGAGTRVDVASEREAFVEACARGGYDLILSDHEVPGFSGLAALEHARALNPTVPFVFFCATQGEELERKCISAGADDFVRKDEPWKLPRVVQRHFDAIDRRAHGSSMSRLVTAVKELSRCRTLEQIAQVVRTVARQINGADGATFVLRDGDQCFYFDEDAIAPLWKGHRFPLSACISGWSMTHKEHVVIPDIYADARVPHDAYRPTFVKSLVMVPVRKEAPIAAIGNYWATPHTATADEVELIQALADSTSVAMENVEVYADLERRVRDRTAQLEATNKELEAYSASVSHDLRNPLGQVLGFADLLKSDASSILSPTGKRYVDHILSASHRMNGLIGDLLRLASVSRTALTRQEINLHSLARDVIAEQEAHRVRFEVATEMPANADAALMRVVVENLLSNAVKYSGKVDSPLVQMGMGVVVEGQQTFFVRDNGAGFDMTQAMRLFTPFGRLHTAKEFPGTGIGLATCQRIVHRHGGRMWAESAKGMGATFWFSLPLKPTD